MILKYFPHSTSCLFTLLMSFEAKAIELLDGNIREIICDTGVVNGFFDMTPTAQEQ